MDMDTFKAFVEDAACALDTYDFEITAHTVGGQSFRGAWSYAGADDGLLIVSKDPRAMGNNRSHYFSLAGLVGFTVEA